MNGAGLAIFRYRTRCGTVYGHTGVAFAYTQFAASTSDGARSATVSINSRMTPSENPVAFAPLGRVFDLAVCAASPAPDACCALRHLTGRSSPSENDGAAAIDRGYVA